MKFNKVAMFLCVAGSLTVVGYAREAQPGDDRGGHGKPVQLHLDKLWSHNITVTTGLVDTATTPMLLKTVISGKLQPEQLITHHFTLKDVMKAYDTFADAINQRALKVIITNAPDIM